MIHYHGLPITPATAAVRAISGGHAFVSFRHPDQLTIALECAQSFAVDNGAFSAWRSGEPITDWSEFYEWVAELHRYPTFDFAVIPDVIDGDEAANDVLLAEWPWRVSAPHVGAPVWHLHESLDRLDRLVAGWPRICLGSSGEFAQIGTPAWWTRMAQAMDVICDRSGRPACKVHGLRMLDPAVFSRFPFASADSTNIGQNIGIDSAWKGTYTPPHEGSARRDHARADRVAPVADVLGASSSTNTSTTIYGDSMSNETNDTMALASWPERIWLQGNDTEETVEYRGSDGVSWCAENIFGGDVEYVRADVLDAANADKATYSGCIRALERALAGRQEVIGALQLRVAELIANHAGMVQRCAILRERDDLPVDRIPAYEALVAAQARNSRLEADCRDWEAAHKEAVARLSVADAEISRLGVALVTQEGARTPTAAQEQQSIKRICPVCDGDGSEPCLYGYGLPSCMRHGSPNVPSADAVPADEKGDA